MRVLGVMLALTGCGGDSQPAANDNCADLEKCSKADDDGAMDASIPVRPEPSSKDASTPGASTADASAAEPSTPDAAASFICPLEDNDDICSTCLKFSCCEEIIECGPACQALVQCANACPSTSRTDPCAQRCYEAHPEGAAAFTAFAGCVGVQCEEACSSSS